MVNTVAYSSYFSEVINDNNNNSVTDLNAGLQNLYVMFNENANTLEEVQRYLVSSHEVGYPELVARNSTLGSQAYWWWLLLLNRLDDPFVDIKENWVYSINSTDQVNQLIETSNNNNSTKEESRLGSVVELN